jgi:hypothetical protein
MESSETVSFEEAIAHTQAIMEQMEQGALSNSDLEQTLAQLVKTENGARGFFVTYLTDERSLADQPSPAVIQALTTSPEIVAELLVKNLAMSSAMEIAHRRNDDELMAQGSERVRSRTTYLIQQLDIPQIAEKLQQLNESASTGQGAYRSFLERWGYDAEQRQVISDVSQSAMPS